jgi:4-hydroxybenzoyl-CoA thioesterase/acyl-CoA thioester hydrolase
MHEHRTRRKIEFVDTDMVGIVHFARFFVFMETAEHEFLAALGTPVLFEHEGRPAGWPRVAAACEYLSPARFGDVLDIHLKVERKGRSSLTYAIDIARDGTPVARGRVTTACCLLDSPIKAIPIPAALAAKIEEAPGGEKEE